MARDEYLTQEEKLGRIFDALVSNGNAASSYTEIATLSGLPISDIGPCLSYLRKDCEQYGWTIPQASVGRATGLPKFFIAPLKDDGTIDLDPATPENLLALHNGLRSTIAHVASRSVNEARALLAFSQHLPRRSPVAAKVRAFSRTLDYLGEQAEELLPQLTEILNGTTGGPQLVKG